MSDKELTGIEKIRRAIEIDRGGLHAPSEPVVFYCADAYDEGAAIYERLEAKRQADLSRLDKARFKVEDLKEATVYYSKFHFHLGRYHVGTYCGSYVLRLSDWKTYELFKRNDSGSFSIGPILFWREQ